MRNHQPSARSVQFPPIFSRRVSALIGFSHLVLSRGNEQATLQAPAPATLAQAHQRPGVFLDVIKSAAYQFVGCWPNWHSAIGTDRERNQAPHS
jgi:hypothetical protein